MLGKNFSAIEHGKKDKLDKNSAELATFNQKSLFVVDWKNDGDKVQHLDFSLIVWQSNVLNFRAPNIMSLYHVGK